MDRVAVVGGSLAGLEAAKAFRREGFTGELVVYCDEARMPYDRPPLSKELLDGTRTEPEIVLDPGESADADWRLDNRALSLDAATRAVTGADGRTERFDAIVVATGVEPIRPAFAAGWGPAEGVHVLRTLADSAGLLADLRTGPGRVVVVGAGFIGAEVASTARAAGLAVTVVDLLDVPMARILGEPVGAVLADLQRDHGVDVRFGASVSALRGLERVTEVVLGDGTVIPADVVVVAVGVVPTTGWLHDSGLTIGDGVVCDANSLAAPGIAAAGDVARWPNGRFGVTRRVEHWDNAIRQGRHAAGVLLHGPAAYEPVPWFWSDQFGVKLQLAGEPAGHDGLTVVTGSLAERRFCGLYRRGDRLVAAVTVNAVKPFLRARQLIDRSATWVEAMAAFEAKGASI